MKKLPNDLIVFTLVVLIVMGISACVLISPLAGIILAAIYGFCTIIINVYSESGDYKRTRIEKIIVLIIVLISFVILYKQDQKHEENQKKIREITERQFKPITLDEVDVLLEKKEKVGDRSL